MATKRKTHTAAFKAQVALAAIKGDRTINQVASQYDVHPTLIHAWKKQLLAGAETVFASGVKPTGPPDDKTDELYAQIGRLKVELDWVKKNLPPSVDARRALIDDDHPALSIRRQCALVGLNRSTRYYDPVPETAENLRRMRWIDEQYTRCPFYGSRRITAWLAGQGHEVNRKRVQRLLRIMGLEAIYPRPKLSAGPAHKVYPYLLRGVAIDRVNQVWSADITYVPLPSGFMYLAATIDWFSRSVIAWRLLNTLDGSFCQDMLDDALGRGTPEVFNTDQGVQFTARSWIDRVETAGASVSMDGRGRCLDNVFVERLWRSVKYEDVYLRGYESVSALTSGLRSYFAFYNGQRLHQSLDYRTPAAVYEGTSGDEERVFRPEALRGVKGFGAENHPAERIDE
nr:IS3 family transposase [Fimbriiglobus ruber]